jgi:glycosyltransferase involved in cell wall biosynthesis
MPWLNRKYYRYFTPKFAKKATRIATVSNYSKNDIVVQYNIDPSKIDVIYNGANDAYKPLSAKEILLAKEEIAGGQAYFVFIGALNPRKNLVNLFKAFDTYKKETGSDNKLVVVGEKMYWSGDIKTTFEEMEFQKDVVFTGRLNVDKLIRLIASAISLTYVSYFEGFGIPIVEAFKAGTPVITSNVTSMPEVASDAAILVDPFNPDEIASAMKEITKNEELRNQLIEKGFERSKLFSWDNTAEKLWKTIMQTIK